jgi:hypothetical protein
MNPASYRSLAVGSLVLGSCALPLGAPVALQYEGGALPLAVLAGAHFLIVVVAARLAAPRRRTAAPRVDFVRAAA